MHMSLNATYMYVLVVIMHMISETFSDTVTFGTLS